MNKKEEIGKIIDDLDVAMARFKMVRESREDTRRNLTKALESLTITVASLNEVDKATDEVNAACREAIRKTLALYNSND